MLLGHGGNIYKAARAVGCKPEEILDFSSNVSPLPLKREFLEFLIEKLPSIQALPEPDSLTLREGLAERTGLLPENFLVGSGTTEWIFDIPSTFDVKRVLIPVPTYSDYEDAARRAEKETIFLGPFVPEGEQTSWIDALRSAIEGRIRPKDLVFLCNPNNPTGSFIERDVLYDLVSEFSNALWVIDESYAPFVAEDPKSSLLHLTPLDNCLVLRSFSKIYGIPGLRIGVIAGAAHLVSPLAQRLRPWSVGTLSQLAGIYLLKRPEWEAETRQFLEQEKAYLQQKIGTIEYLRPFPSNTHFFLVKIVEGPSPEKLTQRLLSKRILVRNCANFRGLEHKDFIRISPRLRPENHRLVEALEGIRH